MNLGNSSKIRDLFFSKNYVTQPLEIVELIKKEEGYDDGIWKDVNADTLIIKDLMTDEEHKVDSRSVTNNMYIRVEPKHIHGLLKSLFKNDWDIWNI